MDGNYNGDFRVFFYIKKLKKLVSYCSIIMRALASYIIILLLRKTILMISQDKQFNRNLQKKIKLDKNYELLVLFPRVLIYFVSDFFLSRSRLFVTYIVSLTSMYFWFLLPFILNKETVVNQIHTSRRNNLFYLKSTLAGGYL